MNRKLVMAATTLILLGCAGQNSKLTDGAASDREALESYVLQRAAPLLAPGERLSVEITDLDRAGEREPWRPGLGNTRVVRDVYPARIVLGFKLMKADGSMARDGTRTLAGLPVAGAARYGEDPLRYERALLDDWLERELRRAAQ